MTLLADIIAQQTHAWLRGATMFTDFGRLALALAAIGLLGGSVLRLGVRQGLLLEGLGIGIGTLVALALARSFASLLLNEPTRARTVGDSHAPFR